MITRIAHLGNTNDGLIVFFTSISPSSILMPFSGFPAVDGQKAALALLDLEEDLPRNAAFSLAACAPSVIARMRWSRIAEGTARRSRACASVLVSRSSTGIGEASEYVSCKDMSTAAPFCVTSTTYRIGDCKLQIDLVEEACDREPRLTLHLTSVFRLSKATPTYLYAGRMIHPSGSPSGPTSGVPCS